MKPAYTLFLKTGPSCNAGCVSCPSGRKLEGDIEKIPTMRLEMFKRIIDRVLEQNCLITGVIMHYYNEPTANPWMAEMVAYCRQNKILSHLSTHGGFPEKLKPIMAAGLDSLIFSVSGWTNPVHQRSHKGIDIEAVRASMRYTSDHLLPHQWVRVGWHDYAYNRHEQPLMRAYAKDLGFVFDSYQTSVRPYELVFPVWEKMDRGEEIIEHPAERDLLTKMTETKQLCYDRRHFSCPYQYRMVSIDGNGMLYCCAGRTSPDNIRQSVFDVDLEDFQERRWTDPQCVSCKSVGGHVYAHQKHHEPLNPLWTIRRRAEDFYRYWSLGAYVHPVQRFLLKMTYERPRRSNNR